MEVPDFTGFVYDEVKQILIDNYPHITYDVVSYQAPFKKNVLLRDGLVTKRIVRQRMLHHCHLQLIISEFQENIV